ncbi:MAG: ATP synthase F1 subunit gamma [Armatimonadetes bacterium]|nr:ATP synthase F1 subunit gamma [Armatimonadota bacterium]
MISQREIKNKIRTVRTIEQICRAMKTVASIRLRRAEERLERARRYNERLGELARRVASMTQAHPFLQERPVERTVMVVVTSDRGLCGGYNANAMRRALAEGTPADTAAVAVGRRGQGQLARHGYEIVESMVPLGGEPEAQSIWGLADRLGAMYAEGKMDRLVLVYTRFLRGTRSKVTAETVLPVKSEVGALEEGIFEPAPEEILRGLMERYLRAQVLGAVMQASASEHAQRVAAMTAASDNAEEMIGDLTLQYNKARQASITKELTEIVGAAEATA